MCFAYLFACCCCRFSPRDWRSKTSKRTYLSFLYRCSRYYQLVVRTKQTWSSKKQEKKVDFTKSPKFADSWSLLHQFINWEKFTNDRRKWSSIAMVFFFFTTLCDWSSKLVPYTRTTRSKTKKKPACLQAISRVWGSPSCHRRPLMLTLVMFG